ncbi:MAG: hypothetical protein WDO19_03285 [Bacteroidota bacterium]
MVKILITHLLAHKLPEHKMFANAFIHPKGSNLWGWDEHYISVLQNHLNKKKIPAYYLAFWILKDKKWSKTTTLEDILNTFFEEFEISSKEISSLFDLKLQGKNKSNCNVS